MKKVRLLLVAIAMVMGFAIFVGNGETVSAKSKTIPVSLRGKWSTHKDKKGNSEYLKISKSAFYNATYHKGKKTSYFWYRGSKGVTSTHTFPLVSEKGRSGYWSISGAGAYWDLKATKIKYKGHKVKVLKRVLYGVAGYPNRYSYYYKK